MKKLIAVTLILAVLALPVSGLGGTGKYGEQEFSVFGRWTMYFDAREYNKSVISGVDFDVISLDLYIFENGSCYILPFRLKDGAVQPTNVLTGMWMGDSTAVTMQFGDLIYKAEANYGYLTLRAISVEYTLYPVHSVDPATYFNN